MEGYADAYNQSSIPVRFSACAEDRLFGLRHDSLHLAEHEPDGQATPADRGQPPGHN